MSQKKKLALIMRGLPGSGKSYWVEQYIESLPLTEAIRVRQKGLFSTDSYFYQGDEYKFDIRRLSEFHQLNLVRFIVALSSSEPIVICDNTNLARWESLAYEAAAKALGYQIKYILIGAPLDVSHQELCAQRNSHNVSLEKIQQMAQKFEAF